MQFIRGQTLDGDPRRGAEASATKEGRWDGPSRVRPRPCGDRCWRQGLVTGRFATATPARGSRSRSIPRCDPTESCEPRRRPAAASAEPPIPSAELASDLARRPGRRALLPEHRPRRLAGGRGAGLRPRPGDPPSRHQAVEPADGPRRDRLGRRLRPGQAGRRGRPDARRATWSGRSATWPPSGSTAGPIAGATSTAWASTLYELLTLRPAFDGADQPRLMQQILRRRTAGAAHARPPVPRDLETIS